MRNSALRRKTAAVLALALAMALFAPAARAIDGIVSIPIENKTMRAYVKGSGDHTVVLLSGWATEDPINDFKPLAEKLSDEYRVVVLEYFGYGSRSCQRSLSGSIFRPAGITPAAGTTPANPVPFRRPATARSRRCGPGWSCSALPGSAGRC